MKIGIMTLAFDGNYGGILQAYALQTILSKLGYEPKVIKHSWGYEEPKRLVAIKRPIFYGRRLFLHYFINSKIEIRPDYERLKEFRCKISTTQKFIDKYIDFIPEEKKTAVDCLVAGSDQIWRGYYMRENLPKFFLDFIDENSPIKKVAYAASFGTDSWGISEEETIKCKKLAEMFKFISVREESGVELCKKYLGVNATWVLDPTMLLEKEDYIDLINNEDEQKNNGSLFYYILDGTPEKMALVKLIAQRNGLVPFKTRFDHESEKERDERYKYGTVTAWLSGFRDAEFVVTDSFHGCVFSIIFNKPFIAIGNKERGMARFNSLLKIFKLEDRLAFLENGSYSCNHGDIDWDKVNSIRREWKEKAINLLNRIKE